MRAALRVMLTLFILAGTYTGGGVFIPPAAAQTSVPCAGQPCDQGMAYQACMTYPYRYSTMLHVTRRECALSGPFSQGDGSYSLKVFGPTATSNGQEISSTFTTSFKFQSTCAKRPDWNGPYPYLTGGAPRNGSVTCNGGCKQAWYSTGDGYFNGKYSSVPGTCENYDDGKCKAQFGDGYYFNQGMSSCEPEESKCPGGAAANSLGKCEPEPCPEGKTLLPDGTCKTKENECPAGNIKSPDGKCLPGEGQCAQGEARGKDGTCKKDSDGDGEPDEETGEPGEEEPDSFSGGDDCKTPPSCSGSAILCGQARIQWRIDCNTRRNRNIAGGMCNTQPICTGDKCDAMEYSSLLMQWRTACALEKAANGTGNNGDLAAIRNALTGTGGSVNPGTLPGSDAWVTGSGQPTKPNTAGYGWSGSCPAIPAVSFMGTSIQIDATPICNWLSLGSFFVMGLAALGSLRIVATKDS